MHAGAPVRVPKDPVVPCRLCPPPRGAASCQFELGPPPPPVPGVWVPRVTAGVARRVSWADFVQASGWGGRAPVRPPPATLGGRHSGGLCALARQYAASASAASRCACAASHIAMACAACAYMWVWGCEWGVGEGKRGGGEWPWWDITHQGFGLII